VPRRQAIDWRWHPGEPRERARVMLRPLDLVELVIRHPGFRIRFGDSKGAIGATPAAAKSFCAIVSVADVGQVQASIAPADIAAYEQRPIGLAQRAEAVGHARERADHAVRLEPTGGHWRVNFLPSMLAHDVRVINGSPQK
jgi:hypothetical protein